MGHRLLSGLLYRPAKGQSPVRTTSYQRRQNGAESANKAVIATEIYSSQKLPQVQATQSIRAV